SCSVHDSDVRANPCSLTNFHIAFYRGKRTYFDLFSNTRFRVYLPQDTHAWSASLVSFGRRSLITSASIVASQTAVALTEATPIIFTKPLQIGLSKASLNTTVSPGITFCLNFTPSIFMK